MASQPDRLDPQNPDTVLYTCNGGDLSYWEHRPYVSYDAITRASADSTRKQGRNTHERCRTRCSKSPLGHTDTISLDAPTTDFS